MEFVPLLVILVVFWLLIMLPAQRRRKAMMNLQAELTIGDDVMLTSGIFATVVGAADDRLDVELAPGTVIQVVRGAIASKIQPVDPDGESIEDDEAPEEPTEVAQDADNQQGEN